VSVMDLPPAWPELLQFLFQCTSSPDPLLREVVWRILAALPNIFGNQQDRYETTLSQLMLTAISDTSSLRVRAASPAQMGAGTAAGQAPNARWIRRRAAPLRADS